MRLIDADELLNDLIFPSEQFKTVFTELINDAPTVELTLSELAQYCETRRLVLVESAIFEKMKSRCSTEPIKHGHWLNDIEKEFSAKGFANEMRRLAKMDNPEVAHYKADMVMCELLSELGYGDGVEIFKDMFKWYA